MNRSMKEYQIHFNTKYARKCTRYKVPWVLVAIKLLDMMVLAVGVAVEEAIYMVP